MKTQRKRRRQGKTDYKKRINLLKGDSPRVVFRKTNKYIISQYVTSNQTKDSVEIGVNSKQLLSYGWPDEFKGSLKSLPASYLTGFLMGKRILKEKKQTPVVDFGMTRMIWKTKTFAFLKGLVDAGVKIKHEGKIFPSEDRIIGKHLKEDFSKTFEKIKTNIMKE